MTVELAYSEQGAAPAGVAPLVILHGLYGSGRNWATTAKRLAEGRRVVTVDLRNHGDSPWADAMDYRAMADDLRALLERLGAGPAAVIDGLALEDSGSFRDWRGGTLPW